MIKTVIGIIGIALFVGAVLFGVGLLKDEKQALSLDNEDQKYGMVEGPLPCKWEVEEPERVISENKSQAILIKFLNDLGEECASQLTLRAPGFDISPVKEEQTITLADGATGSLSWILTPRKSGTFEISVSDPLNTKIFGITVKNMFGLTATQGKIASIAGTIFGPMFTVPWWFEKWWSKRKRKNEEENKDENKS